MKTTIASRCNIYIYIIKVFYDSSIIITKKQQKKDKRQVNSNLEREYRDCIKSRLDKIGHIMMHQVLYIVQLPNEEGDIIASNPTDSSVFLRKFVTMYGTRKLSL